MGKIISTTKLATTVKKCKNQNQKIVLAGGCFDILHPGHVVFLEKAKKAGDCLIILLESDKKVRELKGANRPVHTQRMRAKVLSALQDVDCVILLPFMSSESYYDDILQKIKPDVIAVTSGYGEIGHHQRSARLTRAKLKFVTKKVNGHSTSRIIDC